MNVGTAGDAGDIIFLLGILQELEGGPHTLLLETSHLTTLKVAADVNRMHTLLQRLVCSQPYIKEFRPATSTDRIDWHSGDFRTGPHHIPTNTLQNAHLSHLRTVLRGTPTKVGHRRWLTVERNKKSNGKVVINRTQRYNNPFFPWEDAVEYYTAENIIFIGTPVEHLKFCDKFGSVPYEPTRDLWEAACLIAGSALFMGNQSCANAISEGLKHTAIQETSLTIPDCVFVRDNIQHVGNGACVLPDLHGGDSKTVHAARPPITVNTAIVPNGGWQINGEVMGSSWKMALINTRSRFGLDEEDAKMLLLEKQAERFPHKFAKASSTSFASFNKALATARLV